MRRLSALLLYACCTFLVLFALLVSVMRLTLPYMDHYRTEIASLLSSLTGSEITLQHIDAQWLRVGPAIKLKDLRADNETMSLEVHQLDLVLNLWHSLFSRRWQFQELTFSQLHIKKKPNAGGASVGAFSQDKSGIEQLLLHRVDHFSLKDSEISFFTPSGQAVALHIPTLTWYNDTRRHRAEGEISLDSFSGQHGRAMLRLDLSDNRHQLDNGKIWIQAKNIDLKPWLGHGMAEKTQVGLAQFDLTSWISLAEGQISAGDILLDKGKIQWQTDKAAHQLDIAQLNGHLQRQDQGWILTLAQPKLMTDGIDWSSSRWQFYWQPSQQHWLTPSLQSEVRVRGRHIELAYLTPLLTLIKQIPPDLQQNLTHSAPTGTVDRLALDIPLSSPEKSRFQIGIQHLTSQGGVKLPSFKNVDIVLGGSLLTGEAKIDVPRQRLDPMGQLQAPVELDGLKATFGWDRTNGLKLYGNNLALSARALSASGHFSYQHSVAQAPHLEIRASIHTTDGAEAWRYFPVKYMPSALVRYLSSAIKGGQVDGASLVFSGDPRQFPFRQHQGRFQIYVPLRHAKFSFQPTWPMLDDFSIDLNFVNNGLWMKAPQLLLGKVVAKDVTADIPDYQQDRLMIGANIEGQGKQISDYFAGTPLKDSVGLALQHLVVGGPITGDLALNIPLDGHPVEAKGTVNFSHNSLFIKPLATLIVGLTGQLNYHNGDLTSQAFTGNWYGQPIRFDFNTQAQQHNFMINTHLKSEWNPATVTVLPAQWRALVAGRLALQATSHINLQHDKVSYNASVESDLGGVSGRLPSLLCDCGTRNVPVHATVTGDMKQFIVKGSVDQDQRFISQWSLRQGVSLSKGVWDSVSKPPPALPNSSVLRINLPKLNGDKLVTKIIQLMVSTDLGEPVQEKMDNSSLANGTAPWSLLPDQIQLHIPSLSLAGQNWTHLSLKLNRNLFSEPLLRLDGDEIHGGLKVRDRQPWQVHLDYLSYHPQWQDKVNQTLLFAQRSSSPFSTTFRRWPDIDAVCQNCWLWGQQIGKIDSTLTIKSPTWLQIKGTIFNGKSRLSLIGDWNNRPGNPHTALKGRLYSDDFYQASQRFGYTSPLRAMPIDLHYDLHWPNTPWQPDMTNLSGLLKLKTGKGQIDNVSTGKAAQILRLFSLDALLRRVKLDFRDTFKNSFYFNSINASAWIEQGILNTDNLSIDGLEADIDMAGKVDLTNKTLALRAKVVPEISAPVGVAAAFAINPIAGAVVFAASKVLSPWWSKIALLNYDISGALDKPQINKVPASVTHNSK